MIIFCDECSCGKEVIPPKRDLLAELREGAQMTLREQILLTLELSLPAILAQISTIVMQYIDAAMVGRLGADESASIGLVTSSTWLVNAIHTSLATGFTVQVAHAIGAKEEKRARDVMRQAYAAVMLLGLGLMAVCMSVSRSLPVWLGGDVSVQKNAAAYFFIYGCSLPMVALNNLSGGLLQSSGNMRTPSILHVLMCLLDVVFNSFLIFPGRTVAFGGWSVHMPGFGLGVAGAALGTALAVAVVALVMFFEAAVKSPALHFRKEERFVLSSEQMKKAVVIAVPVAFDQAMSCGAQVASTRIVAPLGNISIAANSFAITAESLCYMPGFGIGAAATTLIGQSVGAKRRDLTRHLGWLTTILGVVFMTATGALMYLLSPWMMAVLTPVSEIIALGVMVLRIEAFAEPFYAASIVANGVFRGAGNTLVPSLMNCFSMWAVRIPLAACLAPRMGLRGVWIAMCIELCFRGVIFLVRLSGKRWENISDCE